MSNDTMRDHKVDPYAQMAMSWYGWGSPSASVLILSCAHASLYLLHASGRPLSAKAACLASCGSGRPRRRPSPPGEARRLREGIRLGVDLAIDLRPLSHASAAATPRTRMRRQRRDFRAASSAVASSSGAATTMLTRPACFAAAAVSGRPITRNAKARACPISRGAIRLEPASGTRPSATNGVDNCASSRRDDVVAMQEHSRADADGAAGNRRDERLLRTIERVQETQDRRAERAGLRHLDEIDDVVAGAEARSVAGDEKAGDVVARARAFDRLRHGLVHGKRQRVLLLRPVHPDGADRAVVGDDDVGHGAILRNRVAVPCAIAPGDRNTGA